MLFRSAGHENPILALTGAVDELEEIHQDLCEIIQLSGAESQPVPTPSRAHLGKRLQSA